MAIAYKSQGAGVSTETSGAALSPACPATVDAGDILIAHVFWEGTATAPSTPSGWDLLHGPEVIQSTIARHWVFGRVAAGTEDGTTVAFGNPAVTTQRAARIYSFSGRLSGTILDLVNGFSATSHATDPQMPTVTTTEAGNLAVALIAQNDNNTAGSATGETGGDWTESVAEYVAARTPGLMLQIQTCTPTGDPGTVTGGTVSTTNDPCGVIGFQIRQQLGAFTLPADGVSFGVTGTAANLEFGREVAADTVGFAATGTDASLRRGYAVGADTTVYAVTGTDASLLKPSRITADPATYAIIGTNAGLVKSITLTADTTAYSIVGADAGLLRATELVADTAGYVFAGTDAGLRRNFVLAADSAGFSWTGTDAGTRRGAVVAALTTAYAVAGTDATLDQDPWDNRPIRTAVTAAAWA